MSESPDIENRGVNEKDLLAAVGQALANWSAVEMQMSIVFGHASEMPREKARAAFDAIINFDARLAALDAIMAIDVKDEVETEMWTVLSARLSRAYKKRHEVAHFMMIWEGNSEIPKISPFCSYDKLFKGPIKLFDRNLILDRSRRFTELLHLVSWFALSAEQRRGHGGIIGPLVLAEHQGAAQLRALAVQRIEARKRKPPEPPPADPVEIE